MLTISAPTSTDEEDQMIGFAQAGRQNSIRNRVPKTCIRARTFLVEGRTNVLGTTHAWLKPISVHVANTKMRTRDQAHPTHAQSNVGGNKYEMGRWSYRSPHRDGT